MMEYTFYSFATLAVMAALAVVLSSHPVRSVLWLILTFLACAVLWLLAGSEFMAFILILVYVGAVMTLFLFVIMMLDVSQAMFKTPWLKRLGWLLIGIGAMIGLVGFLLYLYPNTAATAPWFSNRVEDLGLILYTDYAYPFILAGLLLLVAIVAAIVLVHEPVERSQRQHPPAQMQVQKAHRLRLVDSSPADHIDVAGLNSDTSS